MTLKPAAMSRSAIAVPSRPMPMRPTVEELYPGLFMSPALSEQLLSAEKGIDDDHKLRRRFADAPLAGVPLVKSRPAFYTPWGIAQ